MVLCCGCGRGQEIAPGRVKVEAPVVRGLTFWEVEAAPVSDGQLFPGRVESSERSVVSARLDGRVARLSVKEGETVAAGALLMQVVENTAGDRLREAEAGIREAGGGVASAQARLRLAEKELARYEQLRAREAVTPQEYDRVVAERELALQALATAEAGVGRAEAGRATAATALQYTQVTAPFRGRVVSLAVKSGSTVMPGMPLATLEREGGWQARVDLPESLAGTLTLGQSLAVEIPARHLALAGVVAEIAPGADPLSHATTVKLDLPGSTAGLVSGLFLRVSRPDSRREAILIPELAVVQRGQLHGVYVVEEGILHYRLVKPGGKVGTRLEILAGLQAGDRLVVAGVTKARHGARVEN